jgi:uncharacterized protein (TIGR04255 family)
MSQRRHYEHAPITEALIDVHVRLPDGITLETLAKAFVAEEQRYPTRRNRMMLESQLTGGAEVGASARQMQLGYLFVSPDERQIVQARLDGFAFSRLVRYERWETLRAEAERLWRLYRSATGAVAATRVAVRYLNRLDLPLPLADFDQYLRTVPEISSDLPQGLSGYLMQLQIPQPDLGAIVIINEAMITPPNPDVVSVLLDIDVFREGQEYPGDEEIWQAIEQLHARETETFEACITDRTREMIA